MITPAGKECSFFYGDYFRGRNHEECRLLMQEELDWEPSLCEKCPIPDIIMANGCENMEYYPTVNRPLFFMKPQVNIQTYCTKCECDVKEPRVGCGECHPNLNFIVSDTE